ncbi:MAG: radical SAM protein [Candidatus Latescibacteria bacterium]|nr:radical SAM protein [Candidatus Latescibacterota bacterium]
MIARRNITKMVQKALSDPGYAWQAFHKRLRSALSYHLYDGRSAWPETISLFLTYKCNLTCSMCGQWGDAGAFKELGDEVLRERLSKEEICAFIDDVAFFRPNITLFGGEPMLYKGWTDIVAHIKRRKMRCNMVTNGTLMEVYAGAIVEAGLDEIILSIDGREEVHDHTRGAGGGRDQGPEGGAASDHQRQLHDHGGELSRPRRDGGCGRGDGGQRPQLSSPPVHQPGDV